MKLKELFEIRESKEVKPPPLKDWKFEVIQFVKHEHENYKKQFPEVGKTYNGKELFVGKNAIWPVDLRDRRILFGGDYDYGYGVKKTVPEMEVGQKKKISSGFVVKRVA